MLQLVPFNPAWVSVVGDGGQPLLDIKAIYQRPHVENGEVCRDAGGFVIYNLTTPLPVQHHARWVDREFKYVTLSTRGDLAAAYDPQLRERGITTPVDGDGLPIPFETFIQNRRTQGPWDASQFLRDDQTLRAERFAALGRDVAELGRDRVEAMHQRDDPGYRLPDTFAAEPPKPKRGRPRKAVDVVAETPAEVSA